MKTYRTLLFDVDDTLLDFQEAQRLALRLLFEEQRIELTEEIEARYKQMNQGLWKAFEEGRIDRDEVVNTRFSLLLKEYGQEVDGALLEQKYRGYLEQGHQLIDGALEIITELQGAFDLHIVTNGVSQTQDRRLRDSGLHPMFTSIFVSEDTGYQKPMKEFFDYVFARISNFDPQQALIIGDSLSSDMKGGKLAGLDTYWFNPEGKSNDTAIVPTYEIRTLQELNQILGLK